MVVIRGERLEKMNRSCGSTIRYERPEGTGVILVIR